MATMWPRRLPREIRRNPLRSTECRVYDRLDSALDERWHVFYSRPWLGLSSTGEEIDGEADFVVAHADHGFISIEVKGGEIRYDPATERWTSTDRNGIVHTIKNPVGQARTAKHRVLDQLKKSSHWVTRRICIRHGVMFPDTRIPDRDFGLDRPRYIFADHDQLTADFAGWIIGRFQAREPDDSVRTTEPLGDDGIRALTKLLADPFHLRVPLGHLVQEDDQELELLTERQYCILSALRDLRRIAVRGGAGTGKTVLALEAARRAADDGGKTLLTCFNSALAAHLRSRVGPGVDVHTFHALCGLAAARAGLRASDGIDPNRLHEHVLPELLVDAADLLTTFRYDTIVVDEGQDFLRHWWPALQSVLVEDGRLIVFYDSNQRLYQDIGNLPKDVSAHPVPLNQNLRSTDTIHNVAMRHYAGEPILPSGVPGVPVDARIAIDPTKCREKLLEVIARLSTIERVAPDDIAILVANEAEADALTSGGLIGRLPVAKCDNPAPGAVIVDTIRRFKGLEAQIVVVVASPALIGERELAYVATSRPRAHLIGIGDRSSLESLGIVAQAVQVG